jgi:hypothetical protein
MGVVTEIKGFKKAYYESYSVKHLIIQFLDNDDNFTKKIIIPLGAFDKTKENESIQLDEYGIRLKKPKNVNIFPYQSNLIIYYIYDEKADEILENINKYNEYMEKIKKRNLTKKLSDYVYNKKPIFDIVYKQVLEPCEMFTSQLSIIDQDIHDESLTVIKIQGITKKKPSLTINKNMIIYLGAFVLFIVMVIIMAYGKIRLN